MHHICIPITACTTTLCWSSATYSAMCDDKTNASTSHRLLVTEFASQIINK